MSSRGGGARVHPQGGCRALGVGPQYHPTHTAGAPPLSDGFIDDALVTVSMTPSKASTARARAHAHAMSPSQLGNGLIRPSPSLLHPIGGVPKRCSVSCVSRQWSLMSVPSHVAYRYFHQLGRLTMDPLIPPLHQKRVSLSIASVGWVFRSKPR